MLYKEALSQLNKHKVVITTGNELFYRDQIKNKLILNNPNCEIVRFDCEESNEQTILNSIQTKDLFISKRLFVIKNFTKIKKLDFFTDTQLEDIVLLDSEKAGRSKAFDEFKKKVLFVDCNKPKPWEEEDDAVSKILGFLKSNNLFIEEETARYFYNQIGYNLYKITSELKKLVLFKENDTNKLVIKKDINNICVLGLKYNIFDIIDEILKGNKKEALILLDKLFKYEKNPSILLISLWYTHFDSLLFIKTSDKDITKIVEYVKLPSTVINKKLIPQSEKIVKDKIIESLDYLVKIDFNLRKGNFNLKFYLEKFILNF